MRASGSVSARLVPALAVAAAAALAVVGCTGGSGGSLRGASLTGGIKALQATVDPGKPSAPAAAGYAGSLRCIGCHGGTYASYERTAHARGLRTSGRPSTEGEAVAAERDFRDGLDLGTLPAFASLGAAAPRLSFAAGADRPFRFTIGTAAFEIEQVYGGRDHEAYLASLGRNTYPAPMEYDVLLDRWVAGDLSPWYDGTTPRFGTVAAAAAGIDRSAAAERRCLGCHAAGFTVAYDSGPGEWVAGYTELGVGCESCHGPGLDPVLSEGDPALISNPRDLVDGSAAGASLADDTCARCHIRGEGATLAGAPDPLLYAWNDSFGRPFRPGDEARFWVAATTDPDDFFGYKDNALGGVPTPGDASDDAWVAARRGWMQGTEHGAGAHAASKPFTARCFDCHAAHGSGSPSEIVRTSPILPEAKLSDADGSLCLACHAGFAPFADITGQDVTAFTRGNASGVPDSVVAHMKDGGMPVDRSAFKPEKTGVGRCTTCHMVSTNTDPRGARTDRAGNEGGAPGGGTHTGLVIWPSASERSGVTNSCNGCHPTDGTDGVDEIIAQWAAGDPDGDGRLHGYTPKGIMLGDLNASSGDGRRCAQCHVTPGFLGITVDGDATGLSSDDARLAPMVREAAERDAGITCAACHGRDGDGNFAAGENPLRLPRRDLCSSCHNGAGITFADYTDRATAVHFPQKEMVEGTAGSEPPASGAWTSLGHDFLADSCASCHYDTATPGAATTHTFQPSVKTCQNCHGAVTSLNIPAAADYDGSGAAEGIADETTGLLALLKAAILAADPQVSFDGWGFRRNGVPGLPGAAVALQRAAFNWENVSQDGSKGLHNGSRAIKLLQQSYRELTGVNVPGAVMR